MTDFAPLPPGPFSLIYADPPWDYYKGGNRNARRHYPVIPIDELMRLPVREIAHDDSVLALWCISAILPDCLRLASVWGFTYSTKLFAWAKLKKGWRTDLVHQANQMGDLRPAEDFNLSQFGFFGMGNYTRAGSEDCYLFRRGKGVPVLNHSVRQVVFEQPGRHSQKPDRARDDLVKLFGDVPRIELFARQTAEGWASWGNQL